MLAKDLKSRHLLENRGDHVVAFFHACEIGKVETVRSMLANDFELYRLSNVGKPICIFTPDNRHNALKSRESFYRKLVLLVLATNTSESASVLNYINKLFTRGKLNPIINPYKKSLSATLKGILPHKHDVSKVNPENYSGPGSEL